MWTAYIEDFTYKIVEQTEIPDTGIFVSTVWLGIDHGWGYTDRPIIFETMIFGLGDEYCERFATEEEALAGHQEALRFALGTPLYNMFTQLEGEQVEGNQGQQRTTPSDPEAEP